MNRCFFKVHKGTVKCDYFVALLFGCGSLMWPFVALALKGLRSEDGGLKTIINQDLLTISVPFSIDRVKLAKLNEICCPRMRLRSRRCFFVFFLNFFDFLPWVKVAYLKHLVHCKCHECTVWYYTGKEFPHNLWCNCSDVSMCADKQIPSVGLDWSIAADFRHCWNARGVTDLCLFDCAQPRRRKWSSLACPVLCGNMMDQITFKHLLEQLKGQKAFPVSWNETINWGKADKTH